MIGGGLAVLRVVCWVVVCCEGWPIFLVGYGVWEFLDVMNRSSQGHNDYDCK